MSQQNGCYDMPQKEKGKASSSTIQFTGYNLSKFAVFQEERYLANDNYQFPSVAPDVRVSNS